MTTPHQIKAQLRAGAGEDDPEPVEARGEALAMMIPEHIEARLRVRRWQ